jgi:hypothetical protein
MSSSQFALERRHAAEEISQELLNQYEVSFAGESLKPGDKLELSSKRKGVKVNAPTRLAG